jgi:hypothetical protein
LRLTPRALPVRHAIIGAVVILGLALPIALVWSVQFPAQLDTYNHLARHYLELLQLEGKPLPPGFVVDYRLLPNLGGDLVIPPLIWLFGPLPALKVFLTLAIVLYWLGPALFIQQTGEYSASSWIASLLLLPLLANNTFFWGFLNYYSGVGVAFLVAVHLRHLDRRGEKTIWALLVHAGLLVLLFFWHLAAIFIYGVLLAIVAVTRLVKERQAGQHVIRSVMRAVVLCLPMVPAIGLYLLYVARLDRGATELVWPPPLFKLEGPPLTLFHGYHFGFDAVVVVLWTTTVLLLFGRSLLLGRGTITFLVLYAVLPIRIGTQTVGVDQRVLPALLVCALAWLGTLPVCWSWTGMALLTAAIVVRAADTSSGWHRLDARLRDEARSFALIKPYSSVLPIILISEPKKEQLELHFVCLAVVERHAYVPTLFAFDDQQPLRLTGETRLATADGFLKTTPLTSDGRWTLPDPAAAAGYDYLWIYNPVTAKLDLPPEWDRIFASQGVTLWQRQGHQMPGVPSQR